MRMDKANLTPNQKERLNNINYVVGGIAMVGAIAGVIYAKKTGGGFWRYVGYWIAGGVVIGVPARLVALPFKNKILKEADKTTIVTPKVTVSSEPIKDKELIETLQNIPNFKYK